jgi:protein involved in polysaccharide export with SLBB domain
MIAFIKLDLKLTKLPVRKSGVSGLKPFGYDLFKDSTASFAPMSGLAGAIRLHRWSRRSPQRCSCSAARIETLRLQVGRDGRISFPELGPISVGVRQLRKRGGRYRAARGAPDHRCPGQRRHGRHAFDPRVRHGRGQPAGQLHGQRLVTISSALYAAGGIKPIGSLRDIQLKRRAPSMRRLDLYDLLLRGDTSDDTKLLPGDVIFIPPVSSTVAVDGEVARPAIYEIKGNQRCGHRAARRWRHHARRTRVARAGARERPRPRVVVNVPLDGGAGAANCCAMAIRCACCGCGPRSIRA